MPATWRSEPSPAWPAPELRDVAITGDRYTSREFFAREWDTMWTRVWLLLGRAAEMAEPGDYQVEEVGPESLIMVRQRDGSVRSFYNVCQHRGSRLTFAEDGSTPPVSYTHLTLPTITSGCRSRWSPYH